VAASLIILAALVAVAAGFAVARGSATAHSRCPQDVLPNASATAPVGRVLQAAQRQLANQVIHVQGRRYHLTPRNAPINFIAQIAIANSPAYDERIPGLLALHRFAARACGEQTAQASWAIHYDLPVGIIAGGGAYTFFVQTRSGWRFWGSWCGVLKSPKWRRANCP
jgi:hypothetical protein